MIEQGIKMEEFVREYPDLREQWIQKRDGSKKSKEDKKTDEIDLFVEQCDQQLSARVIPADFMIISVLQVTQKLNVVSD